MHRPESTKCENGLDDLGNALGKHLAQGVSVVGVITHNIAVTVGIKILYGKALHMTEHGGTDIFKNILGDLCHGAVIEKRRENTGEINCRHYAKRAEKCGKIRVRCSDKRSDIVIDKGFDEKGRCHACNGCKNRNEVGNLRCVYFYSVKS